MNPLHLQRKWAVFRWNVVGATSFVVGKTNLLHRVWWKKARVDSIRLAEVFVLVRGRLTHRDAVALKRRLATTGEVQES